MPVPPSTAAALLAWASATDNRDPDNETAARAWADALDDDVTIADGKAAISAHRASTDAWLMPSHINAGVRAIRRQRLDRMTTPQPPETLDGSPVRELAWQRAYRAAIGDGRTEGEAMAAACTAVGIPTPAPTVTAPRPVEALTRGHGRQCGCGCLERPIRAAEGAA